MVQIGGQDNLKLDTLLTQDPAMKRGISNVGSICGAVGVGGKMSWIVELFSEAKNNIVAELVLWMVGLLFFPFAMLRSRYNLILGYGGRRPGSQERELYDNLRKDLATRDGTLAIYAKALRRALDWLDVALGDDAKKPKKDDFAVRLFGLKNAANIWTAASLDWCLLFALIYTLGTVYFIWAVTGEGGAAGTAVFLPRTPNILDRIPLLTAVVLEIASLWAAAQSAGWKRVASLAIALTVAVSVVFSVVLSFAFVFVFASAVMLGSAVAFAVAFVLASAFPGAVAGAIAGASVMAFSGVVAGDGAGPASGAFVGAFAGAGIVASAVNVTVAVAGARTIARTVRPSSNSAIRTSGKGVFLSLFIGMTIALCFVLAWVLSPLVRPQDWKTVGTFLLFFALLPLLNAPFDFLSLGLTRGFLRRGLQEGGFSLLRYALIDAIVALVIIVVLAVVLVIAIQLFGNLELRGGQPVRTLDLQTLLDSVERDPLAGENWWVYALFLTTQAPSLFNLAIGSISLGRRIRWLATIILRNLPDDKPVIGADRVWLVPLLIVRLVLPVVVGVGVGLILIFSVVTWLLPMVDLNIVSLAKRVVTWSLMFGQT